MNVSTGGPHILLFERDQQLAALLTSEFQLAGYEFHVARTAVEVFDAIARHPVRLVMVNLAQAAAGRREFWVALDAQRRGRGVQVFTFRCINLAGYGPQDPDDHGRTMLADMEVDGMLGIMSLVDAVRARVPFPAAPNSQPRFANPPAPPAQPSTTFQSTVPLPSVPASGPLPAMTPTSAPQPAPAPAQVPPTHTFTDKIRAVIYPSSRSFSPAQPQENTWNTHTISGQVPIPQPPPPALRQSPPAQPHQAPLYPRAQMAPSGNIQAEPYTQQYAPSQAQPQQQPATNGGESSLAQLSRLLQEQFSPVQERSPAQQERSPLQPERSPVYDARQEVQARPVDAASISGMPLRASPIQDIPLAREQGQRAERFDTRAAPGQYAAHPSVTVSELTSIKMVVPPPPSAPPAPPPASAPQQQEPAQAGQDHILLSYTEKRSRDRGGEENTKNSTLAAQAQEVRPQSTGLEEETTDTTLLDIMQSLPPMSPAPPPPVLSGRATRALGNVLLEGHLVPQDRLEVAQNVQRMLRGVDLNYQLGEILLMFKLLTPDQLLAASLVSYGLITTAQIRSLGRIRQELHSIGLEYDLENLIILFRILTPEQLREVRASWLA